MTPEEVELLSQLTIVILTYNRPRELERSIEYWRDTPVTVHILDGSKTPWFPIGRLRDVPKVNYHHMPPENNEGIQGNYCRRMGHATTLPTTKYSALCADDDVFSVSGLNALLRLLENNFEIDAVVGQSLGFYVREGVVRWWLRYGAASVGNSFSRDTDAVVRLRRSKLMPYYAVVRTDFWKKRMQITKDHGWLKERWETLFQDAGKALFRSTSINQIVWFRSKTIIHPHEATSVYIREWANGRGKNYEVDSYADILVEAILLVSPDTDKGILKKRIHEFVKNHPESRGQFPRFKIFKNAVLIKLLSRLDETTVSKLPVGLREELFRYYIPAKIAAAIGTKKVLDEFLPSFLKSGISFDLDELKNFEELLLKPREELRLRANI